MALTDKLTRWIFNDQIMLSIIMLNTVVLFIGEFLSNSIPVVFCDTLFTLMFVYEAVVKIAILGWKPYWRSAWNKFDFIVLLLALPSLASPFFEYVAATNAVLVLRSLRLFKSLKMFHFIPNIYRLLIGVKRAIRSSLLIVVVFILLLIIFSILSSTIFGEIAPEYFDNPITSLYSLFRLFTIDGWYEIPETIAANSSTAWAVFARCYFSVLVFCGGIIGMSLINSIFVDAMAGDNNDEVMAKLNQIEQRLNELSKDQKHKG